MDNNSKFGTLLKANGLKVTKHRYSILELLENSPQPLTVEEIYFQLKKDNININLSSVYRILDTLIEVSLISKLSFEEKDKTLYELKTKEHKHHLICSGCKQIFPITHCPISNFETELSEEMNFQITNHKIEIYGYCKNCRL